MYARSQVPLYQAEFIGPASPARRHDHPAARQGILTKRRHLNPGSFQKSRDPMELLPVRIRRIHCDGDITNRNPPFSGTSSGHGEH